MGRSTLRVGIIGVNPAWGWAATAHIPALRALPNYEIRALSARSSESARAAGDRFGVSAVFSDQEELVAQPDIDVVAVTVKVPHHRELVSAALAAGKAAYCEWPLGRDWPSLTSLEGAPAYNVGRAYAAFAADIDNGTHIVPDFADAVRRHEVIAAIERSAASGERVKVTPG